MRRAVEKEQSSAERRTHISRHLRGMGQVDVPRKRLGDALHVDEVVLVRLSRARIWGVLPTESYNCYALKR